MVTTVGLLCSLSSMLVPAVRAQDTADPLVPFARNVVEAEKLLRLSSQQLAVFYLRGQDHSEALQSLTTIKSTITGAKNLSIALDEAVGKQVHDGLVLLADKLSLARVFNRAAQEIAVLDEKEAKRIIEGTEKVEKVANLVSSALGVGGVIALAVGADADVVSGLSLGSIVTASAGTVPNTKTTRAIGDAVSFAVRKAERLSIHAYLITDIRSSGTALTEVATRTNKASDLGYTTDAEVIAVATEYVAILKSIDAFYDFALLKLKATVDERATSEIYSEESKGRLRNLSQDISDAADRWSKARAIYSRSERAATDYLAQQTQP
jgi:hypothetical protein